MKKWFAGCGNVKLFELHKKRVNDHGGGLQLCDACEAERQRAVDDVGSSGSDGEDEAQDGESDSEASEQEHQIIVNELLCYAFT